MKATEVYSWRLEHHLKEALEMAAKSEKSSVAALLSRIVQDWLRRGDAIDDEQAAQNRVRESAASYLGSVRGGDPSRAAEASSRVRRVIRSKHASRRVD